MTTTALRLLPAALASVLLALPAAADHPGPLREAPLGPLATGLITGGLALGAGVLIVVIVMLLTRGQNSSE